MKEIRVLTKFPIILTKDTLFLNQLERPAREGSVFILPDDAVLVLPKTDEIVSTAASLDLSQVKPRKNAEGQGDK